VKRRKRRREEEEKEEEHRKKTHYEQKRESVCLNGGSTAPHRGLSLFLFLCFQVSTLLIMMYPLGFFFFFASWAGLGSLCACLAPPGL